VRQQALVDDEHASRPGAGHSVRIGRPSTRMRLMPRPARGRRPRSRCHQAGSRASGAVISACSSACAAAAGGGLRRRPRVPASPATSVRAACALPSSTRIMASTVTASCPGCQQSKSVTMATEQ
jgi:hypothetical protein